ncbi:hypothetical protein HK405_006809, partial [Cladochytrium tenue]
MPDADIAPTSPAATPAAATPATVTSAAAAATAGGASYAGTSSSANADVLVGAVDDHHSTDFNGDDGDDGTAPVDADDLDDEDDDDADADEGFDESWAEEFPLYSRPSGPQTFLLTSSPLSRRRHRPSAAAPGAPAASSAANAGRPAPRKLPLGASPRAGSMEDVSNPPIQAPANLANHPPPLTPSRAPEEGQANPMTPRTQQQQQEKYEQLDAGSQRNRDSVLHYFVATEDSEHDLDRYFSRLIQTFLDAPPPDDGGNGGIHAGATEDPNITRARFGRTAVPRAGDVDLADYLHAVKVNVIDRATRVSSARMIGHMTSALPYFHRPLARLLAALNQNVVKLETAATLTYLERETVAMLHREFFQLSDTFYDLHAHSFEHSLGVCASGGTVANITALWAARNRALRPDPAAGFRGVDREGLPRALAHYGYRDAVVVGSAMMHYSFKKAADLLGLGDEGLVLVPTDDAFCVRVEDLARRVEQLRAAKILVIAIVGIAGTTETGSIDNLAQLAAVARHHGVHFHVDAAWGGPLIFSREHRPKLDGIGLADTITVDGHKQLYTPMGLGVCLFRQPGLAAHIRKTANYVIRRESPDLGKFTLEGSRAATALHLHASLHLLGRDGIEALVTRSATLARQLAARLQAHPSGAFQPLHKPMTNILLYRYVPRAGALRDK